MRKLLAILLLAVFSLPFASSLFALSRSGDARLPACCRRNGKHHCMAMQAASNASLAQDPRWSAPPERCPFAPAAIASLHPASFAPPLAQSIYAGLVSHPAGAPQTESKLRIAASRSRGKRGPPPASSL